MLESLVGYLQANYYEIMTRFIDFFIAPFRDREMIWMIIPLIITIVVMEDYFSRHSREEIGWNTAIGNSMILIFISMDLFRFLFNKGYISFFSPGSYKFSATMLVLVVLLEGILLFILDFGHFWPEFFAYHLSSYLTINLIAYTVIVTVYSGMPISLSTLFAALGFYVLINAIVFWFRFTHSYTSMDVIR